MDDQNLNKKTGGLCLFQTIEPPVIFAIARAYMTAPGQIMFQSDYAKQAFPRLKSPPGWALLISSVMRQCHEIY